MIKQKVFFSGTVLAIFLSLSNVSLASGLDKNMQSLVKSMSILQSSNDKSSLLNALEMMDKSVDSSMNIIPEKIDVNDKVSVDNYKEELKKLQHEINIAKKKVEDGNIESLRESLDKMNDIKLEGHRKFR
ncbi:cytochrome B562 [Escherichia coli]|uniref:cytochrome b562 n=1 Tax=Escherichia coli TaxID=562 RepID=UPI000BE6AE74|nr:cytochrome b562 [Escherichia coli]EHY2546180.1 cytochrome B562 [Escherichia coli]EHY2613404.1 cytochrome B562 [Escherichia coli]MBB6881930.1 cytochrome B562 [Escherichia coli]MBB8371785.1 cytochrome B562 [Escherichia coli]